MEPLENKTQNSIHVFRNYYSRLGLFSLINQSHGIGKDRWISQFCQRHRRFTWLNAALTFGAFANHHLNFDGFGDPLGI